jgi:ankyrin
MEGERRTIMASSTSSWTNKKVFLAALQDDVKTLKDYQADGGDLTIADDRSQTLLHLATRNKSHGALAWLLAMGLDPDVGDKYLDAPLHIAAHMGDEAMIRVLLASGADPDVRNHIGETPLHQAALRGSVPAMKALLGASADLYALSETQTSVMQYAVRSKKPSAVRFLVEAGAILNSLDNRQQSTMHYAATHSTVDIVRYLIDQGVNPYGKTMYHLTPLHLAVDQPHTEMLRVFLDAGCTSYDESRFGQSPYDLARQKNRIEAIEQFQRWKNDRELQDRLHANGLTFAIVRNEFDKAVSLAARVDVNERDLYGNTPLFYAIMNQEPYLVDVLLRHGASTNNIDRMNLDAIHYAVLVGDPEMVRLVLKKTTDLSRAYLGHTVREFAERMGNESLVQLLEEHGQ